MKYVIIIFDIVVLLLASPYVIAQNGGFNGNSINANEEIIIGAENGYHIEILDRYISLQSLTNAEIIALTPQEGMLVYDTDSDILKFYDGVVWKSYMCPAPALPDDNIFRDQNGNLFLGVQIGTQLWMDRNLKATHYPNGDVIPYITDNSLWAALEDNNTDDAYCYYDNNPNSEYGALYSYSAAIADDWGRDNADGQGICPDGWHLPTDNEWTILTDYLGGLSEAGNKIQESGLAHWNSPNDGINDSGFTVLPGGLRNYDNGGFNFAGSSGYWWSATESIANYAWVRGMNNTKVDVNSSGYIMSYGLSVRCLRN